VRGPTGPVQEIAAVIDTVSIAHSPRLQQILPPWVCRGVTVDAADIDPLVGMRLHDGYELTVQAYDDSGE